MEVKKTAKWENELWSYLSEGDGVHCPIYESCQLRRNNHRCLGEHQDYCEAINKLIDSDDSEFASPAGIKFEFPACPGSGKIFKLVRKLADKHVAEAGIERLPVPDDIITQADDNLPIEVSKVPLKACHGAVWRLSSGWLVQLNSNDTLGRQRFTLYHEIFHILAHGQAAPVFKNASCRQDGYFNELLADQFAGAILTPAEWVRKVWPEVNDIGRLAAIFAVPNSVMWFALKRLRLI
jgi:hypothetical protein